MVRFIPYVNGFYCNWCNLTSLYLLGFDELRNVVRFLSFQADDNEDLEGNDILENGSIKPEQNAVSYEKVPKRLEVAADIVDGKNGSHRRTVRKSSYRSKEKRKKLQRLASMPGMFYFNLKNLLKS